MLNTLLYNLLGDHDMALQAYLPLEKEKVC